jgi:hypothetical protein
VLVWLPPRQPYILNPHGLQAIPDQIPVLYPNILLDEIAPFGTASNRYFDGMCCQRSSEERTGIFGP